MAKYLNNRVKDLKVGVSGKTDSETVLEVSGNVSAGKFIGDGSGLEGVFFSSNDTGIHTTSNVGIGTTTADGAADPNNTTILNAGIVTAVNYYGKGVGLTSTVDAVDGEYGTESTIPSFTISNGRITSITTNNINSGGGGGASIFIDREDISIGSAGTINFGSGIVVSSPSSGVVTVTSTVGYFAPNDTGIHTTSNVGIGTTTADGAADPNNTIVLNAGIVTANYFYGSGDKLTNLTGASEDTYGNPNYTPIITVDSTGRITGITTAEISGTGAIANISEDADPSLGGTLNAAGYGISNVGILTAGTISISGLSTFHGNVGIGTTNAASDSAADPNNTTVLNAGIVTANYFYGDATGLTSLTSASADTYGSSNYTPVITVDSTGRITGITTIAISGTGAIANISEDADPELGGDLDLNNRAITGIGTINITGSLGGDFLSAPHGSTVTLAVTVSSKTSAHRYPSGVNGASGNAYYIDGIEAPFLTLTPGRTYRFDQSDNSNDGHPLLFYLESDKTTKYTTNVTTNGTSGNAGAYTEIEVTDETPIVLHYQCESHNYMGNGSQTNSNYIKTTYDSVFLGNVGIGTTNAASDSAADSNNTTVLNAGIVTAREYYGNNINITGVSTVSTLKVGTAITASSGIISATSFYGDGTNITNVTSTNSTNASNINLSDESTDTTCFPIFATNATGNQEPKTGTNLTFNSSTGQLTASSFSGDGAALTNVASIPGTFDENITESKYISVNSGIGTNTDETNDVFVGPGTSFTFPSTVGRKYIIESIQIANKFNSDLYFTARLDFNGESDIPLGQRVLIPYQGSVEYLSKPLVANPSDVLNFQSLAGVGTTASGISAGLDAFVTYTTKIDDDFVGVGSTAPSTSTVAVYDSVTYPTVLESIKVCNYNLNLDIDASISIANATTGNTIGYLIYNLTIPKNTTIEIIEKPKRLAAGERISAKSNIANSLAVIVSGKKIT